MQKTKLGISVGLLGALLYFSGLFSGYVITIIIAGYVLLVEENAWIRKTSVKAVALMVAFSVISAVVGLIPNAIGLINDVCNIFGGYFSIAIISDIVALIQSVIVIAEKLVFLALGIKAFSQGTIRIPMVDDLVNKHME